MSEIELRDAILRQSLQLLRLSAGQQGEAEQIIRQLEAELRALLQSNVLSDAGKAEVQALIDEAQKIIKPAYAEAATVSDTHALALIVAQQTVKIVPGISGPTAATLASLTKDILIDGAPSSAWWQRQAEDLAFKFAAIVRQGVANGHTNEQIVRAFAGGKNEPGIMNIARKNARSLVHSSVMTAANQARLATFRANADVIAGVRWLATLDVHTCIICGALDGQKWNLDGSKIDGTTVDFMAPPAHFSCRCILTPVPKRTALEESFPGIGAKIDAMRTRATAGGDVPATTTFNDFLKRQSPEFVDEVLGKRRAELFLAGRLTLRDLISGNGRELTLEQLGQA